MQSRSLYLILTLIGIVFFSHRVMASADLNECLAQKQKIPEGAISWNVVDNNCPVGEGLWDKPAKRANSQFWVQCGVTSSLPKKWFHDLLTTIVSSNEIILRNESGRYRCLLGPFSDYTRASAIKDAMRSDSTLSNAFIREVSGASLTAKTSPKPAPVPTAAPASTLKPPAPEVLAPKQVYTPPSPKPASSNNNKRFSSRDFIKIEGLYSPEPYVDDLHHIEEHKAWLRASLPEANSICREDGMRLASLDKLRKIASDKSKRANFPKRLPFWVNEQKAYDMAMQVPIKLTENSALYVMCEK